MQRAQLKLTLCLLWIASIYLVKSFFMQRAENPLHDSGSLFLLHTHQLKMVFLPKPNSVWFFSSISTTTKAHSMFHLNSSQERLTTSQWEIVIPLWRVHLWFSQFCPCWLAYSITILLLSPLLAKKVYPPLPPLTLSSAQRIYILLL